MINGRGQVLQFGGRVMKNVAGYDISRLLTGSLGTLGVLLDISLKVLPVPECERTVRFALSARDSLAKLAQLGGRAYPLSAAMHCAGELYIRLSGARSGVDEACRQLVGGDVCEGAEQRQLWRQLREHQLPFFTARSGHLWRFSTAPATPPIEAFGEQLYDWGGAQRWFFSAAEAAELRALGKPHGGYITCFRRAPGTDLNDIFPPLEPARQRLHQAIKAAFDPRRIFNPGRMYPESAPESALKNRREDL